MLSSDRGQRNERESRVPDGRASSLEPDAAALPVPDRHGMAVDSLRL